MGMMGPTLSTPVLGIIERQLPGSSYEASSWPSFLIYSLPASKLFQPFSFCNRPKEEQKMKLAGLLGKKGKSSSASLSFSSGSSKSASAWSSAAKARGEGEEEEEEELREAFKVFDMDGDGKISVVELGCVLRRLGHPPLSDEELHLMLAAADKDGDGCIDLPDFLSLNNIPSTTADDLRDAFLIFDADHNGLISAQELHAVLTRLGDDACTIDDCRRMIHAVDHDGDGFVDFPEFLRMMTT